jgi:small-conductance mechanosensitive channel
MPDVSPQLDDLVQWLGANAIALLIIVVGAFVILRLGRGVIHRMLERSLRRSALAAGVIPEALIDAEVTKRATTLEGLLYSLLRLAVIGVVILVVLAMFDLFSIIAALGLIGAAIAFAGQDIIRDYLNGALIVLENQFAEGDVIRVGGSTGVSGTVEELALRRTELRDLSGVVHIVPNGEIRIASNMTRIHAGINLDVSVAYGTDMDRAMAVIDDIGRAMAEDEVWADRVLEAPASLRVNDLGDSGVDIKVVGRVRAGDQWAATGELRRRILLGFAEHGIEIPFPHRVVISRTAEQDVALAEAATAAEPGEAAPVPAADEPEADDPA